MWFQDERIFVGKGSNAIQIYKQDDGSEDGIVTRFTAPITSIDINQSGKMLAAGSWSVLP